MQGNTKRLIDNFGFAGDQNRMQVEIINHEQPLPITAQPQQFSRSYSNEVSHVQLTPRPNVINGRILKHCAETDGGDVKPWLKAFHHSDRNSRLNSPDSVIINFDNISEPSTSYSVDLYGSDASKTLSEQFQQKVSSLESSRTNEHKNLSNSNRESTIHIASYNSDYSNQSPDNENNSNNSYNNNNNNNSNNNNNNASVIQSNEGTHAENQNLNASSGNQSLDKIFDKYIPFITFLSLKAIYDHREGILIFLGLIITFIHANSVVKREIAKQSRRSLISLGIIFINLFVSIFFIYFVFQDQQLYKNLIFIPPYSQLLNIWDVFWIVGITDFVLKFITIQLKVGMACFPAKFLPYSSRGKWYLMLERTSQLYRGLVPIQPWLYYLMEVYQGSENIVGMFFSVAYVVSKGSDLMSKFKLFLKALWKLLQNANLGVRPSNEQLVSAGPQCPICHDEYSSPIILQCRHVFCENCVSTWFDREQTCPLCRAKIADDPSWRDGATSLFAQLF